MASTRRRHFKIAKLPDDIRRRVDAMIATPGKTYQDAVDFLADEGIHVGHSSVQRYGKHFLARLERLQVVKDQARAIVSESGERPATEMAEAANQMAIQLVMETLMEVEAGDLQEEKLTDVLKALARLEQSSTARERLKLEYQRRAQKTAEKVEGHLKKKGVSAETVKFVREEILGIPAK